MLRLILVTLTLGITGGTAFADPPPASHDHWQNANHPSHYVLYDHASRTYLETVNCQVFWRFNLVRNDTNVLTLHEPSRNMTMRLDYQGMWLKPAGAADFTLYQHGAFDTRTLFEHVDAGGNYTGSIMKGHACSWKEWFPGASAPAFSFVSSGISPASVEIHDASRGISVRLDDRQMWLRHAGGTFGFFKNGKWRR